jgi:hypothetical protein
MDCSISGKDQVVKTAASSELGRETPMTLQLRRQSRGSRKETKMRVLQTTPSSRELPSEAGANMRRRPRRSILLLPNLFLE